jgi:hypothetical protein
LLHGQHEHWVKLLHGTVVQGRVKVVSNPYGLRNHTEISSLRTLMILPRNLHEMVGSWIRLLYWYCTVQSLHLAWLLWTRSKKFMPERLSWKINHL